MSIVVLVNVGPYYNRTYAALGIDADVCDVSTPPNPPYQGGMRESCIIKKEITRWKIRQLSKRLRSD